MEQASNTIPLSQQLKEIWEEKPGAHLPSDFQIGDSVYTIGCFPASVVGINFEAGSIRYDLEVSMEWEGSGEPIKTVIRSVDPLFVGKDTYFLKRYQILGEVMV